MPWKCRKIVEKQEKVLAFSCEISDKILIRDTLNSLLLKLKAGARDHKEVKKHEQV